MHGHLVVAAEPSPARLAVWTLRLIAFGRRECPMLTAMLREHLGAEAQEAIAASHVLAFVLPRCADLPAGGLNPPLSDRFSPLETRLIEALTAAQYNAAAPRAAGKAEAIAERAIAAIAAAYARRGLCFAGSPMSWAAE